MWSAPPVGPSVTLLGTASRGGLEPGSVSTENLQPRGLTRLTRSISPSWLSWVMELHPLQEPGLGVTEEETEEELEEPLGSTAVLVKPDAHCQLQQMEGTGAA